MLFRRHLLAAALATPAIRPAAQAATRLALIHMNDFHAKHEGVAASGAFCQPNRPCLGGAARLGGAIAEARRQASADGRTAVLLDAGDQFTGSLFFTQHQGLAEAAVQRVTQPDAMALGNHEFDKGPAVLARYAAAVGFPLLSANLDTSAEPLLRDRVTAFTILQRGGARLGVIGLTTETTPYAAAPGPTLRFTDAAEAATRAIAAIRRDGPATIILLSHLGLDLDRKLAAAIPGIDIITGGHSHLLLANGLPEAIGPDPLMIDGPDRAVRILQAGAYGRWLGGLDLDLAADGRVAAHAARMRPITPDLPADPAVAAVVAEYAAPLAELRARAVGRAAGDFSDASCRTSECGIGDLITDAMLAAVPGADVALMNGGGLRGPIREGVVTWADILGVVPFGNTVATLTLRGGDLRAALENGLSRLPELSGRFPQVAGMRVVFDAAAPAGQRLRSVTLTRDGRDEALDDARAYRVVTNDFIRKGGDEYAMFRDRALEAYDAGPPLEDVVGSYLAARGAVEPRPQGRIVGR